MHNTYIQCSIVLTPVYKSYCMAYGETVMPYGVHTEIHQQLTLIRVVDIHLG